MKMMQKISFVIAVFAVLSCGTNKPSVTISEPQEKLVDGFYLQPTKDDKVRPITSVAIRVKDGRTSVYSLRSFVCDGVEGVSFNRASYVFSESASKASAGSTAVIGASQSCDFSAEVSQLLPQLLIVKFEKKSKVTGS